MNNPARKASIQRQRLFFVGGSVMLFVVLIMGAVIITQSNSVARSNVSVESQEEVTLGTVVLVAASEKLPKGTKITAAALREIHWPRDQVPEGAARSFEDVENMYANVSLIEGQPIVRSSLSSTPPAMGIERNLPPGHRAITINVTATTGVEGWATAGAHVDVLLTYLDSKDGMNKTRVVVENAIVLSFGGKAKSAQGDEANSGSPATEISTATLAVPFQDSLKVQTALAMGRITLALRSPTDVASPGADSVFSAEQFDGPRRPLPAPKGKPVSRGFAKFSGKDGPVEFQLSNDNRWQSEGAE